MQTPLEISFVDTEPSQAVEAEIRKRVEKLEKFMAELRVAISILRNRTSITAKACSLKFASKSAYRAPSLRSATAPGI
ncbi:HPF/RaiA family ribosome-associated protein [Thiobacillus sp.]